MKKAIFFITYLTVTIFMLVSCDNTFDDLMTGNVKTGGILEATSAIPYKLGSTPKVDVTIDIPKGPGIKDVEIYRTYLNLDDDGELVSLKPKVLDQTVNIGSANSTDNVTKTVSYTYSQLCTGLSMPADETQLTIGEKWVLSYVSVMDDGRKVDVATTTTISVANFFAGPYVKDMKYFHPTAGGVYPTTPYSAYQENVDMEALNASECWDWFGVWEDTKIIIHINADNSVQLTFVDRSDANMGDPNNPANVCSYDPVTGVIKLYYNYPGSGGFRIFWVTYTPR